MLNIWGRILTQKGEASVLCDVLISHAAVTLLPLQPWHQEEPSGEVIAEVRFWFDWLSQTTLKQDICMCSMWSSEGLHSEESSHALNRAEGVE